eukprot:CAMPEP_0201678988 /NCGR_PEP_ID=MMETSP0494-20130426/47444_1 /ASSEMBLY_ACC=CAM_ASM_000839 /TAXON_ID=420259 /ORGANISM="Thalassiosira gravida, Strain GMp14c1" /LENGTH=148 /DNA_ID=CAMNT_0048162325 /DNA_START=66 /DNA_END=509 /DNA_ORIENTATION=+
MDINITQYKTMRRRAVNSCTGSNAFALCVVLFALTSALITVEALPKPNNNYNINGGGDKDTTKSAAKAEAATAGKDHNKVFSNINENYQSSSSSLDAVTKKFEDDFKERQFQMRQYWKDTFEDIKESNPVVFPSKTTTTTTTTSPPEV